MRDKSSPFIVSLRLEANTLRERMQSFALADAMLCVTDGLSSYLVWVGVKFSNAKEEELLINDASQIGSKKFDF
ncbi:MAG: hypothetical protein SOZ60_07200, partial [Prevotella sp.]|nr:hypothetical protein [Prevotella sp.]